MYAFKFTLEIFYLKKHNKKFVYSNLFIVKKYIVPVVKHGIASKY